MASLATTRWAAHSSELLPPNWCRKLPRAADEEQVTGIYKHRLVHQGKSVVINVSITPLVGKSAERIGRLLLFDDVTQRDRMEEQLTQTEKLTSLGLLAAGVAHEVNTPLAVISNYIQMLAKQMPEGDPRHTIIDKIVKQTFRASEIVNNLLNFSRTGARRTRRRGSESRGRRDAVARGASLEGFANSGASSS